MHKSLRVVGLSYKKAPVEIREIISLDDQTQANLLLELKEVFSFTEALIVSTCNRTEIYYSAERDFSQEIVALISTRKGLNNTGGYLKYFDVINDSIETANYLFRVALGLEAQVVGDLQIINQIKRSYQLTADHDLAGPFLHRLLHTIFFANKRVTQETCFRDGAASVSYATAEFIRLFQASFVNPKALVIGLGEIGEDVVRHLAEEEIELTVTNRSADKADAIALECQTKVLPFDECLTTLGDYDIVVSSVPVKDFIGSKDLSLDKGTIKYLIDLSIPRSIQPEVNEIQGVQLYNIDEIQEKTSQALQKRLSAIPEVEAIIEESLSDFMNWSREMEVSPTIQKLKNALEEIRKEELQKHLKNASPELEAFADKFSKSFTQKIMKLPVLQLKAACKRGEAETLIDVLNDLFNLEAQPEKKD